MTSIGVAQMPTDRSMTDSSAGVNSASGTNNVMPPTAPPSVRKPKILARRRLKESDVNVVNQPMLKKALGGTIVGNTMEWYDVGVFGYLITTMGPGLPARGRQVRPDAVPAGNLRGHLHRPPPRRCRLRLARRQDRPPEGTGRNTDDHGGQHVRRRTASRLRADRHLGRGPPGAAEACAGLLHRR